MVAARDADVAALVALVAADVALDAAEVAEVAESCAWYLAEYSPPATAPSVFVAQF